MQQNSNLGAVRAGLGIQLCTVSLEITAADSPAHRIDGVGTDIGSIRIAAQACGCGGLAGKPIEDGSQLLTRDRLLHAEFRLAYAACNAVLPCPNDCVVSVICFRNVCERDARVRDSRGTGAPVQNQNQIAARHAAAPVEG